MKSLVEYINESQFLGMYESYYRGKHGDLPLPYTFDVYNQGPKNTDFKITKMNIRRIFFGAEKEGSNFEQMIRVPLPADEINYAKVPDAKNTDNWTKIPAIRQYGYCGGWYPDSYDGYSYSQWNKDWTKYLTSLFKNFRGKVSMTATEDKNGGGSPGYTRLVFSVNDDKFNQAREERIKELQDPKHLEEWKEAADQKEKKRIEDEKKAIEDRKKEAERQKQAKEKWNKWWDSLSDAEQESYARGYGRGKYQGD